MPRISSTNRVTIPVAALDEAGLRVGDLVVIEVVEAGELRLRRSNLTFERAFGALTGAYPRDHLDKLDREDEDR